MKQTIRIIAGLALGMSISAFATEHKVDPAASKVEWKATKLGGAHNGELKLKSGKLVMDGETLKGGEFIVDMKTIKVLDVKDPGKNQDLTEHLNSDDFFSTAKNGEAKFTITSATKNANGGWDAKGPMEIKGIKNEITVPLMLTKDGKGYTAKGTAVVDRTKFDIKYRSGRFFPQIGDKVIHDNFDIAVTLKAK